MSSRILTSAEMREVDAAASVAVEVLVERAGTAVALRALGMLRERGGIYGRRVVVLAGTGNNGWDGRVAARLLRARGVAVTVIEVSRNSPAPLTLPACDLVIDAVLGTGATGDYRAPEQPDAPVLAVDIPSGVSADDGTVAASSTVLAATRTVTFAAWKPGLLFGRGAELAGEVEVADIGLAMPPFLSQTPGAHLVSSQSASSRLRARPVDAHKWSAALFVIAGSPGMYGAASLCALGGLRAGAGMVRLATTGGVVEGAPIEAVGIALPLNHWSNAAIEAAAKCHAVVIGPGLGRARPTLAAVRSFVLRASQPIVVDADAVEAFAADLDEDAMNAPGTEPRVVGLSVGAGLRAVQQATARRQGLPASSVAALHRAPDMPAAVLASRRPGSTILTPHDREYERLAGRRVGPDRIAATRLLAQESGAVVLLKGPVTVVADPTGRVEVVRSGDQRLATAGSGDVLAGVIGAFLARGLHAFDAAVCAAAVHGAAALSGPRVGLVASDLPPLIASYLSDAEPR